VAIDAWLVVYCGLSGIALGLSALLTLQTFEFRRYVRSRCSQKPCDFRARRVALLAPCKGLEEQLVENLRPLFAQDHSNYEIVFIVESADDPACAAIRRLMAEHPRSAARLVIAGVASDCGQKVHNLLAATATLDPAVEVLAFVDSDARPRPEWLRRLVEPLGHKGVEATTAYRWMVPSHPSLAHCLLFSINSAVGSMIGPGKHHMVWGGAWAINRLAFDRCGLREAWRGTLSDDLVAARTLARAKLKVHFEPAAMVASPIGFSWSGIAEFVRRQYTIGRVYSPRWWAAALAAATLSQAVFWGSTIGAIVGAASAAAWWPLPAAIAAAWYALSALRGALRQGAARRFLPEHQERLRTERWFDIWLGGPVAGLANWIGLASAALGRRIVWRGIAYEMFPGGQVRIARRELTAPPTHVPAAPPLRKAG
jgi:hypothetical protein